MKPRILMRFRIKFLFLISFQILFFSYELHSQNFEIGRIKKVYIDENRSNRSVACEIFYPSLQAGEGVPVANGSFPTLIFAHGFVMTYSAYDIFWDALVPNSYVLIMLDTETGFSPSHQQFALDIAFLSETIKEESENPASMFYQTISGKTAALGHSMGGGASFLAMDYNPLIDVIVNFAAAETNPSAVAAASNIIKPALIFAGETDCITPPADHQIPMYQAINSEEKTLLTILNGNHCYFASENLLCSAGELICPPANIQREQQLALSLNFTRLWLDFYLKDDCEAGELFQLELENSLAISFVQQSPIICTTNSIDIDSAARYEFTLQPNPSHSKTLIKFTREIESGQLSVYNQNGKLIAQYSCFTSKELEIDHPDWPAGVYHLRFEAENKIITTNTLIIL